MRAEAVVVLPASTWKSAWTPPGKRFSLWSFSSAS